MIPLCISASWQIEVGELCAATLPEHARTNFNACQPICLPSLLKVYCIWMCLVWRRSSVRCRHGATSYMRWNKPNRRLRGVVVVPSCKDNIFNILVGFGTLKQKVWTLMARWILGLTHAKLEESTSCTPSCYGPTWHLQSWLVGCNGLTTYGNFRARGLSDTTWMHWYRAVQAAIGEELHHYMWQNNAGFWMLGFDSSSGWCYAMPSTSCSFLHIRSWRRPRAKSNKSKISGISEQELTWADCACSRSRNSPVSNRHSSQEQSV